MWNSCPKLVRIFQLILFKNSVRTSQEIPCLLFREITGSNTIPIKKVTLSLKQAMKAHRVVRRRGPHIFQTIGSQMAVSFKNRSQKLAEKDVIHSVTEEGKGNLVLLKCRTDIFNLFFLFKKIKVCL
jgi:hypothetical protein